MFHYCTGGLTEGGGYSPKCRYWKTVSFTKYFGRPGV